MKVPSLLPPEGVFRFAGFTLDARRRILTGPGGEPLQLLPKVFDTLLFLVSHAGKTVEKSRIMAAVWPHVVVEENNLTQCISALRRTLGERPNEHRFIVTVPGHGYRFVAPVSRLETQPQPLRLEAAPPAQDPGAVTTGIPTRSLRLTPRQVAVGLLLVGLVGLLATVAYRDKDRRDPLSIAVLPFKPLLLDSRNEAIELGMADSLIVQLSRIDGIVVRPLTSTRQYSAPHQDALSAGRELGVDIVADGTLHITPDRLRVSVRVVRVANGVQLWAEQFDQPIGDLFTVQDAIATETTQALSLRLADNGATTHPASVEAYELYMLGKLYSMRLVMPDVLKGVEYHERALLLDPAYPLPYLGIAEVQWALVLSNDVRPAEVSPRATLAARRAVELDPKLAEAHYTLGMTTFIFEWDWARAERHFSHALVLKPADSMANIFYALLLSNLGRKEQAIALARRARELDPRSPFILALEGEILSHQGVLDQSVDVLRTATRLAPDYWLGHHLLSSSLIDSGHFEEAIEQAVEASRLSPRQTFSEAFRGVALARLGRIAEARLVLQDLVERSRDSYVPPYHVALVHAALGDTDEAIGWLEKAFEEKDVRLAWLNAEPKWEALRTDPRFSELMRRLRFS